MYAPGRSEGGDADGGNLAAWSLFFLCFPVISTTFASVERQFRQMLSPGTIGYVLIDEAGQAVNYFPVGLLQRGKRVVFLGDPLQLEPVFDLPESLDASLANAFFDENERQDNKYLVRGISAQGLADRASPLQGRIDDIKIGLPLRVHRRCAEPMFSISNRIAYNNNMIMGREEKVPANSLKNCWIDNTSEAKLERKRYFNPGEIEKSWQLFRLIYEKYPGMLPVYILSPFRMMAIKLRSYFRKHLKENAGLFDQIDIEEFVSNNIGTIHTFQGKEANTVISCLAVDNSAQCAGGIKFVNQKPNLVNVAITRAKNHFFVIGNHMIWKDSFYFKEICRHLKVMEIEDILR